MSIILGKTEKGVFRGGSVRFTPSLPIPTVVQGRNRPLLVHSIEAEEEPGAEFLFYCSAMAVLGQEDEFLVFVSTRTPTPIEEIVLRKDKWESIRFNPLERP